MDTKGFCFSLGLLLCVAASFTQAANYTVTRKVYFDVEVDGNYIGRILFGVFEKTAPITVRNFLALSAGTLGYGYQGSIFHRVVDRFMIQGGDISNHDGTGFMSIYGGNFADETFVIRHTEPYLLGMANAGPNTNGAQIYVTTVSGTHWLDGKHVIFGKVLEGHDVTHKIEKQPTNAQERVTTNVVVTRCGVVNVDKPFDVTIQD